MYDIFISYSRKDKKIVDTFVSRLQKEGFSIWIDRKGIESGDAFKSVIVKAISDSNVVLFFSSEASNQSKWTAKEIGLATEFSKPIIPIKLDSAKYGSEVMFDLVNLDYIDYTDPFRRNDMMEKLISVLYSKIGKDNQPPTLKRTNKHYLWYGVIATVLIAVTLSVLFLLKGGDSNNDSTKITHLEPQKDFVVNGLSFRMQLVKGGSFSMGAQRDNPNLPGFDEDAAEDESPVHEEKVNSFYMLESEVTQAFWKSIMGEEPIEKEGWTEALGKGDDYPAYNISWNDTQVFLKKLDSLTQKQFRLPTEAEWEYAARGGHSTSYKYSGSDHIEYVCWYAKNATKTSPVKNRQENELHLYDMSGNVWEWCNDNYSSYSSTGTKTKIDTLHQKDHVCRGGSWGSGEWRCRVSTRKYRKADHVSKHLGFRIVLDL